MSKYDKPIYNSKVNKILELLKFKTRDEAAVELGYKNYRGMDQYMRRKNFVFDDKQMQYIPAINRVSDLKIDPKSYAPTKVVSIISAFENENADPKVIAKQAGFKDHKEMAEYMKNKGQGHGDGSCVPFIYLPMNSVVRNGNYQLTIKNVATKKGAKMLPTEVTVYGVTDNTQPVMSSAKVTSDNTVEVTFDETLDATPLSAVTNAERNFFKGTRGRELRSITSHYVRKYQPRRIGQSGRFSFFAYLSVVLVSRLPPFPPFSALFHSPPPPSTCLPATLFSVVVPHLPFKNQQKLI